jgi:hypothetical protein
MFFHIFSFSIFVISRGTETYYEQVVKNNGDGKHELNLSVCTFCAEVGETIASLVLYYILFVYSGRTLKGLEAHKSERNSEQIAQLRAELSTRDRA